MKLFRPVLLRIHLEHDVESNSLFSITDALETTKKSRIGLVNRTSSGFVEFSRKAKGEQLNNCVFGLGIDFVVRGRQNKIYLYPTDEETYRLAVHLSYVKIQQREVSGILSNPRLIKIVSLRDTGQIDDFQIYERVNFFWGLDKDFGSFDKEILKRIAGITDPLVAFPQVRYLDNYELYDLYECIKRNEPYYKPNRSHAEEYGYLDHERMWEIYSVVPESLLNTLVIFNRIRFRFRRRDYDFSFFEGLNTDERLVSVVFVQGRERNIKSKHYWKQLIYELRIIMQKRLSAYFLMIKQITDYCNENSIMIGPRGSAAGALISYVLGITNIDPIGYNLFFERFLDPSRPDLPDYDLDFPSTRRSKILSFVQDHWREGFTVAHISAKIHMQAKNSLRTVGKVMGLSAFEINSLVNFVREISTEKVTLKSTLEEDSQLRYFLSLDEKKNKVYSMASDLEGKLINFALHAAGIILVNKDDIDLIGVREHDGCMLLDHDMHDVDYLGLIKVDILGVDALSVIDSTLIMTGTRLQDIPLDDPETFDYINTQPTFGLFQLSYVNSEISKMIRIGSIQDIANVIGLNRPGSMHYIDSFIKRTRGLEPVTYDHPAMEVILRDTQGIFIWQEQIMQMAIQLAGYSVLEANELRRIIGKKLFDRMDDHRERFIEGATVNLGQEHATSLFNVVREFKGYGFNKAHGVAYAHNTYYMAYLLAHYPLEYYVSAINNEGNEDKRVQLIQLANARGVNFLLPDLRHSVYEFTVEDGRIRFGLSGIKYLSKNCVSKIVQARDRQYLNYRTLDIPELTPKENHLIGELFEENVMVKDSIKQYRYLGLVLNDLFLERAENLSDWVFNHCNKDDDTVQLRVRILKIQNSGTLQEVRVRDNKRVKSSYRSKSIKISDGSYTLNLLVNQEQPLQFLNKYQDSIKNLPLCDVTLYFNGSVKNIEVNRIQ